jgi:aminomuconate-semialdehyde/2-hydroxymuconate-6-semialdehyde dehydrogenase
MKKILNYIDGAFTEAVSGQWLDNYNPATGDVYSLIPDSDGLDVELAVLAAQKAFPAWSALGEEKRSAYLVRISKAIDDRLDTLALAESIDNGKPVWLAKVMDIPRASQNFSFFGTAILHEFSAAHQTGAEAINYTYKAPLPWRRAIAW